MKVKYYGVKNQAGSISKLDDDVIVLEIETKHGVKVTLRESSGGLNLDWEKNEA